MCSNLNNIPFFFCLVVVSACSAIYEEPTFEGLENFKVSYGDQEDVTIKVDAIFFNPNKIGAVLSAVDVAVEINSIQLGDFEQYNEVVVPKSAHFTVPLSFNFPLKRLYQNGGLGKLLSILTKQSFELHYKGYVKMKLAGIKFNVDLNERKTIKL